MKQLGCGGGYRVRGEVKKKHAIRKLGETVGNGAILLGGAVSGVGGQAVPCPKKGFRKVPVPEKKETTGRKILGSFPDCRVKINVDLGIRSPPSR